MKVIASTGKEDVAVVYILELDCGKLVECVESIQPPIPRDDKWVLLVSTLFGCPVGCAMCDAGGFYQGKPSAAEIFAQVDFLVKQRYPNGAIPCKQFKIQFARMGEPALNPAVLDVLASLPTLYHAPGLMPSISTVAPASCDAFFERLLEIKRSTYSGGHFQFQFSLHTTDEALRDRLIPVRKWSFSAMGHYGERFYTPGDRKITLNFALAADAPLDADVLQRYFSPDVFLVKITPLNPTYRAMEHNLDSWIDPCRPFAHDRIVESLRSHGYEVIVSIGNLEENQVGSNCGQYLRAHLAAQQKIAGGYTYPITSSERIRST